MAAARLDDKANADGTDAINVVNTMVHLADMNDENDREPTEQEKLTLRCVSGPMSSVALLVCFVEFAERASYYGASGVFSNFIMRPLPEGGNGAGAVAKGAAGLEQNAGALNMGQSTATAITTAFSFLAFTIPLFTGWLSDSRWGRYKTVMYGVVIGAVSHALLIIPAIPKVIEQEKAARVIFIISLFVLAFATGFIKPSLNPLLCDQNPVKRQTVRRLKSGELVIVDPTVTIQGYQIIFYQCIQFGSVFALSTSYAARNVGYWLAFLLPGIMYVIMCVLLRLVKNKLVRVPPKRGVVGEIFAVFKKVLGSGGLKHLFSRKQDVVEEFWNKAKPSVMAARGESLENVNWDDEFVDEARVAVNCCKVFAFTIVYAFIDGGLGTPQNAMAGVMRKDGLPNDLLANFTPISIIVFAPIFNYVLFPALRRWRIPTGGCYRMMGGFMLGAIAMAVGAILQWRIYKTSDCGYAASTCKTSTEISLWWQLPMYALPGIGELLVITTAYEIAYTRAPARMKGLVYAIVLFSFAFASAIVLIISPWLVDPNMIWPFVAGSAACVLCAVCLGIWFRSLNDPMPHFQDPTRMGIQDEKEDDEFIKA
nr:uncharacterized protein CI109_005070 [Kwoniella shandongensis]KAA5526498.1 hypothetical protein CI109_005070 [Kwoniella shandongensis]